MDEDLLKLLDNKVKQNIFKDRDDAINRYVKYGILVIIRK